jgi:hypothetical protein
MVFHRSTITEFLARRGSHVADVTVGQALAAALAGLVVLYGVLLRFDAVTLKYGPVDRPAWLHALQESRAPRSALRPAAIRWDPAPTYPHRDGPRTHYVSDPYTYLQDAREMRSFYAAHRREPLFPFVTKIFLLLLHQQDVAVSFASASFSVLAIVATFLLGWYALSYWVGLGAALGMAIEYDVISWGVGGWRDDAFTCTVVLSALAMLRYYRVPSRSNAVLMGVVGGLSCLIRITSLSFLLPGFACLLFTPHQSWRERLGGVGLGALVATAIVAPFLFNCWLVFGDPFYAIDVHVDVYRAAERQTIQTSETAAQYLRGQARSRLIRTLDTAVLGMTTYPFLNKWRGFDPWIPSSGKWLSWAAVAGVILFFGFPAGRLLLVVLAASLVPYALTWKLISDWRFTEHAYPFFLIAAWFAIGQAVILASPARIRALARRPPGTKALVFWGFVLSAVAAGGWVVMRVLPVLIVDESLRADERATIMAGDRDASFFVEGWSRPYTEGNVTVRVSQGPYSVVRIPLPPVREYDLTVRMDPFPRPLGDGIAGLPTVRLFVNDRLVATLDLRWNPERVGAYDVHLPRGVTREGFNRLAFVAEAKSREGGGFSVWYVRVRPTAGPTPPTGRPKARGNATALAGTRERVKLMALAE